MSKNKQTGTALTVVERAVRAIGIIDAALHTLAKASEHITTITNEDGRTQVHSARMVLKNQRVEIEKRAKVARDDAQKYSKAVIAEEKRLISLIEPEEGRLERLQEDWDAAREREKEAAIEAEVERVRRIQLRIDDMRSYLQTSTTASAADIESYIVFVRSTKIDDSFEEFREAAADAKEVTMLQLRQLHAAAVQREAEQEQIRKDREELEQLRAENERLQAQAAARHVPPEPAEWKRDNEVTRDLLSLTGQGQCVPLSAIEQWTDEQCQRAEEWAGASHVHAADHDDVIVPPIPPHVAQWYTPEARERIDREDAQFWGSKSQAHIPVASETGDLGVNSAVQAALRGSVKPPDRDIIAVLAAHYGVPQATIIEWILSMDFSKLEIAA